MKFDIYGLTFDETTPFVNGNKKKNTAPLVTHLFERSLYRSSGPLTLHFITINRSNFQ
jgi:hypothetical protein